MSKILILGAGRGQVDLIKTAKRLGHTTAVAGIDGNYPGFEFADEIYHVDISNPLEVDQIIKKNNIEGVCTCCLDTGMETLGYLCDKYGFMGPAKKATETSRDKSLMKELFEKNNISTPKYIKVSSEKELKNVINTLKFPVIVKAVDQQGSLGINVAYTKNTLQTAYAESMKYTKKEYCIIEEYINGEKHGANGCIVNNQILFILPSQDLTNDNAVLGHVLPFSIDDKLNNIIIEQITNAVNALKLNNCVFNVDYIIKDNRVYVIEITGRLGANGIPELLSIYYGIDIYELIINIASGIDPTEYFNNSAVKKQPCCSKMIISSKEGILQAICDTNIQNDNIVSIKFFVSSGDQIRKYQSAKDCLGQIIVKGHSPEDCVNFAEEVNNNITFILEEK